MFLTWCEEYDLGVVAPGKLADLLLLEGDPTTSISDLRKLSIVIHNGAVVVDNGIANSSRTA
jgi:imidazolonepropionase-like amidohydrolase